MAIFEITQEGRKKGVKSGWAPFHTIVLISNGIVFESDASNPVAELWKRSDASFSVVFVVHTQVGEFGTPPVAV